VNTFCSLFSQILKFLPRSDFEGEVRKLNAERHARGVSCWQQFVSMMFCQFGRAHSLREIEQGLKSCEGKLSHLGIQALSRSSLSYANAHRPWQLYERTFTCCLGAFKHNWRSAVARGRRSFASRTSWSAWIPRDRFMFADVRLGEIPHHQGGDQLHLLLDHDGYLRASVS